MKIGMDEHEQNGVTVPSNAATDIADDKDQHAKQNSDLYHIIEEELYAAANASSRIQTQ